MPMFTESFAYFLRLFTSNKYFHFILLHNFICPAMGLKSSMFPLTAHATLWALSLFLVLQASYGLLLHRGNIPETPTRYSPFLSTISDVCSLISVLLSDFISKLFLQLPAQPLILTIHNNLFCLNSIIKNSLLVHAQYKFLALLAALKRQAFLNSHYSFSPLLK